jgi:hypothetical protein
MRHPELSGGGASDLPVTSMAALGIAGYLLGKDKGNAGLWAVIGAGVGYYFRPLG